jgi:LmbE family N-acetylglucosaminyl deacetylase
MAERPNSPFAGYSAEQLGEMGTPLAEITTIVDVGPVVKRKRAAMAAHRTQFGDESLSRDLGPEEFERLLSREHFVRVALPWDDAVAPFDPLPLVSAASTR